MQDINIAKIWQEKEEQLAQKLAELTNFPYINLNYTFIHPEVLNLIDSKKAQEVNCVIFWLDANKVKLGVIDPKNEKTLNFIESLKNKGYQVEIFVISYSSFKKVIDDYEKIENQKIKTINVSVIHVESSLIEKIKNQIKNLKDLENLISKYDTPNLAFDILEVIIGATLIFHPSDVHFEPQKDSVVIRFRIDGILHEAGKISLNSYQIVKNRLKILSRMKITFKKIAQDGRFTLSLKEKELEVRSSVIPGDYDETFVLRILDPETVKLKLENLGFREDQLVIINKNLLQPNGMILTTGPTGSGKTTTLYSFIHKINNPGIKIITIEDPIEYKLPGIQQTQVNPKEGYTFSSGLRAILRQDPDVILIGEIRDEETANIAINASLTGHLVISTLHTNSSLGAIPRLVNLKVKRDLIPPALRLVIAQRLVRRVCVCAKKEKPDENLKNKIKEILKDLPNEILKNYDLENFYIPIPQGCDICNFIGYKGRIGIYEMFEMNLELGEIVAKDPSEQAIYKYLKQNNFVDLIQDGILKVIENKTSLEELTRILGLVL
jgi:type II secretory ATPase GspE/PulE/Tfp pilus assembly ATPase PilB-like protein